MPFSSPFWFSHRSDASNFSFSNDSVSSPHCSEAIFDSHSHPLFSFQSSLPLHVCFISQVLPRYLSPFFTSSRPLRFQAGTSHNGDSAPSRNRLLIYQKPYNYFMTSSPSICGFFISIFSVCFFSLWFWHVGTLQSDNVKLWGHLSFLCVTCS